MILKIDFNENNVIHKSNGRIMLKVKYYAEFANVCHLSTTQGSTKKDFDDAPKALSNKSVFVGQKGGLSF